MDSRDAGVNRCHVKALFTFPFIQFLSLSLFSTKYDQLPRSCKGDQRDAGFHQLLFSAQKSSPENIPIIDNTRDSIMALAQSPLNSTRP